jgi:hypothetical protein
MSVVYLIMFKGPGLAADHEIGALRSALASIPGMTRTLIHIPVFATTSAHYVNVDPTPALTLQIYFDDIDMLEAACAAKGTMRALPDLLPSLQVEQIGHQAMLSRHFEPTPPPRGGAPELLTSNLVTYNGPAEDETVWLSYYSVVHAPIMTRLPALRELEICMRIDWIDALPWKRMKIMQTNKVVFDSVEALDLSHYSPVMAELRTDYALFPPFSGGNSHFALTTMTVLPSLQRGIQSDV